MPTFKEILDFWFAECDPEQWFGKDPAFDNEIRTRFESAWHDAVSGHLDHWAQQPDSCLALVILLDQFPRNMYRGTVRMYESDAKALAFAKQTIASGQFTTLPADGRKFLFLPLEHSENLSDQQACLELMATLGDEENLGYAKRHLEIIERFGRFPHRNAILGRSSTPEELTFLEEPGSSF